jgi:hypothetical protein
VLGFGHLGRGVGDNYLASTATVQQFASIERPALPATDCRITASRPILLMLGAACTDLRSNTAGGHRRDSDQ